MVNSLTSLRRAQMSPPSKSTWSKNNPLVTPVFFIALSTDITQLFVCICEFAYLLKFVTVKINTCSAFVGICGCVHSIEKPEEMLQNIWSVPQGPRCVVQISWRELSMLMDILDRTRLQGLLAWDSMSYGHFLCFLLVILWFKRALKCGAQVLSPVPKLKEVVMCLTEENMCVG